MTNEDKNNKGYSKWTYLLGGAGIGALAVGMALLLMVGRDKPNQTYQENQTSVEQEGEDKLAKGEIEEREIQIPTLSDKRTREEEIEMFSVEFDVTGEVPFDDTIISPDDGRRRGYFDHVTGTGALEEMLLDNYGTQIGDYQVQDKDGNLVRIRDMKEEGKALAVSFGRPS